MRIRGECQGNEDVREIRGEAKSIRKLLGGARFTIDYYQREYRWGAKQVTELLNDLAEAFLDSYDPRHDRKEVKRYGHYFLGSIIISDKDDKKFIIDGQQRITSLTLLLIHLCRESDDREQSSQLADLILSTQYGERSFNLHVPERTACIEAIYSGGPFDEEGQPESVVNILDRFRDIEDDFPDGLKGESLPYFCDWLIENVYLVEITAYADADAYTIFETMNDRGMSLTPTEMLKSHLLSNIADAERRNAASRVWRDRITALQNLGDDADADAIKEWLRSQYAETIRERRRNAKPRDFGLIGTGFHRWVRDNKEALSLTDSAAFFRFIQEDFAFYSRWYEHIREAAEALTPGLEAIYFNAQNGFSLQYPVLLAPLQRTDGKNQIHRKLRIVAAYIDILIARRIWNWRSTAYSTMQYAMFLLIKEIRSKSISELSDILIRHLDAEQQTFTSNGFGLHRTNRPKIHRLLARITDYVETCSGKPSHYTEYVRWGYQIEHIWANSANDEFDHESDFQSYRNRIGGLLLLPRSLNTSLGAKHYTDKREQYNAQNLLARSLHERAYEHNPGFRRFRDASGLPFQPHPEFRRRDLDARQELYRQLSEHVWNPEILRQEAEG